MIEKLKEAESLKASKSKRTQWQYNALNKYEILKVGDVERIRMRDNKSMKWATGYKFVQLQKNHAYHSALKCSAYKALFGIDTPMGLKSTAIPKETWDQMKTANEPTTTSSSTQQVGLSSRNLIGFSLEFI